MLVDQFIFISNSSSVMRLSLILTIAILSICKFNVYASFTEEGSQNDGIIRTEKWTIHRLSVDKDFPKSIQNQLCDLTFYKDSVVAKQFYDVKLSKVSDLLYEGNYAYHYFENGFPAFEQAHDKDVFYYTLSYITPHKINLKVDKNHYTVWNYLMTKDLEEENKQVAKYLEGFGIVYRTDHIYGKIGEDYVPAYYKTYNEGQKFLVNGQELEIVEKKEKIASGGYNKEVKGFNIIYQLINTSKTNYLISFKITGTSEMSDIVKDKGFFKYQQYKTALNTSDFEYSKTIILTPSESFKDRVMVGINLPDDFLLTVNELKVISNEWLQSLVNAISGGNIAKAKEFAKNELAKKYYSEQINENLKKRLLESYFKFITISIVPEDNTLFDPDFDSDVIITISNLSSENLKVVYKTPFSSDNTLTVNAKSSFKMKSKSKGFSKNQLVGTVISVDKI